MSTHDLANTSAIRSAGRKRGNKNISFPFIDSSPKFFSRLGLLSAESSHYIASSCKRAWETRSLLFQALVYPAENRDSVKRRYGKLGVSATNKLTALNV